MKYIYAFIKEMRLNQWIKNLLVFAALLFSGKLFFYDYALISIEIFFSFSFVASGVYFINDIFDVKIDRLNPHKSHRPIAAGDFKKSSGIIGAILLFTSGLIIAWQINLQCMFIVISYILINLAYTIRLKHIVIIDVMTIAYGFVARAIVGALAIQCPITTWFLLCIMFLSLFLALGKRRCELLELKNHNLYKGRKVLAYYSVEFIDQLMTIVTTAIIMCYSLFAMDTATKNSFSLILTIPLVIYGIFYYLYLVRVKGKGGAPDEIIYREKEILFLVILYVICIIFIRNPRVLA